ncbi:ParB/RepB/Spo0J family partition protein, partial [candidate division WWE3 bacterium]|nr:ParB/RepB/Spo0J family partition protein [candidate division WWE3 bacterium]
MIRFEFRNLDISSILPNPFRPRFDINRQELINLADSIRQYGIIEPIIVVKSSAGYQILSGERRWKAAKLAGLTEIPAMIGEIGKTDAEIIFLELLR